MILKANIHKLFLLFIILICFMIPRTFGIPQQHGQVNDDCGLNGYEAHCVLDIMEEHIEATAIVNHCHVPLDITFRVVYRYGNRTEKRWQYTFVTTNQNERVLIPGLILPPAPYALVYLYVRVPEPLFDLHNTSLAAIEASFVAVISESEWEEVEFLNEAVTFPTTQDCYTHPRDKDPLVWIIGGALLGLFLVAAATTGVLWWYRRRKIALDQLALVSSLESGLPGAQPYQIGTVEHTLNNNNNNKDNIKESMILKQLQQKKDSAAATLGFKFGRLKEESPEEVKERITKSLGKAVVIGNPILVDKTPVIQTPFNKSDADSKSKKISPVNDREAYENKYSRDIKEQLPTESHDRQRSKIEERISFKKEGDDDDAERRNEEEGWRANTVEIRTREPGSDDSGGVKPKEKALALEHTPFNLQTASCSKRNQRLD